MNPNHPKQNPDAETTLLHLNKFVPEPASGQTPDTTDADDGVTDFIAKAAAEICHDQKVIVPKDAGAVPAESMLGIVSYCYVKGVYGSSDIERKMMDDPAFRASCHDEIPRPEAIRRFRRLNREAIQATLEKVFRRARKTITRMWWPENPFQDRQATPSAPVVPVVQRTEETQVFVRREASDRLDKATFIDGMSF